jgi:4-amino-4-deoxy-L-arabinose transferase-like glycosyltransferase
VQCDAVLDESVRAAVLDERDLLLLRVINGGDPRLLLGLGVACGIGIENKHSTIFFIAALLLALVLTPQRRLFANKWFWAAVTITLLLVLPNLIWQVQHGYPTYVDLHNVKATHKNVELPPLPFTLQQIMMLNPLYALLWMPGVVHLFFRRDGRKYLVIGLTFVFFFVELMLMKGKDYYVAPIYPMLFAAGGVLWETVTELRQWIRPVLAGFALVAGVIVVPITVPVLPPPQAAAYARAFAGGNQKTEVGMDAQWPQYFADEFGWPELVEKTAQLYHSLPLKSRRRRRSSEGVMATPARSISSARNMASRNPSVRTRITGTGDLAITQANQ